MRKIEMQMLCAIYAKKCWQEGNTSVTYYEEVDTNTHARMEQAKIYLHGNHIATYLYRDARAYKNIETFNKWPTQTTKSRLRALGAL